MVAVLVVTGTPGSFVGDELELLAVLNLCLLFCKFEQWMAIVDRLLLYCYSVVYRYLNKYNDIV